MYKLFREVDTSKVKKHVNMNMEYKYDNMKVRFITISYDYLSVFLFQFTVKSPIKIGFRDEPLYQYDSMPITQHLKSKIWG